MRLAVLLLLAPLAFGQQSVTYTVSCDNAVHHEAVVTAVFSGITQSVLELRMSRSSPGRYAIHEYAKNVYRISAVDGNGNALSLERPNPYQWNVAGHNGTIRVTYTVYGDHADGTYVGVDSTHAHFNMPAAFLWVRGWDAAPIRVTFRPPAKSGWKVATQLHPTSDPFTFTAPGLQYFMDSPTELSSFSLREWKLRSNGKESTIRIAMHHEGSDRELDAYAEMAKRVVSEAKAVYGELPNYDVGTYTFLADYLPWVYGDGMEHRNSTIIASSGNLRNNAVGLLGTLLHEYFHSWNVERIRPKSLEPFNFEEANMSGELWFAEGFTSYYTTLLLRRAGMRSIDRFAEAAGDAVSTVVNSPGRDLFSAVEMSMQAPFVDAATAIDETNRENTFISYYTWGEAIGLGLDLTLRTRNPERSLDGFMKAMWERFGKTEIPYSLESWRLTLGEYVGDSVFADDFFRRYVAGHETVAYASLMENFGFVIRNRKEGKASIGNVGLREMSGRLVVSNTPTSWSPLYLAGIDRWDEIVSFDGAPVLRRQDLDSLAGLHKPGDKVDVTFRQRGMLKRATVTLMEDRSLEIAPFEKIGKEVTEKVRLRRAAWLDSKSEEKYPPLQKWCPECRRGSAFEEEYCRFDGQRMDIVRQK